MNFRVEYVRPPLNFRVEYVRPPLFRSRSGRASDEVNKTKDFLIESLWRRLTCAEIAQTKTKP